MPINSSGAVSLGGSTTGQSINLELGFSATAQVSMNDAVVRTLLARASGSISLSDAYGKSNLGTPTSLMAYPPTYESYNNLTVTWYLPASSVGAAVQVYVNGSLATTTGVNVTSVNITGLTANTSYSIYVRAIRNGALSAPSSTVTGTTMPCGSMNELIGSFCDGYANLIEVRGTGSCGNLVYNNTGNNVSICGNVPFGTLLDSFCSGQFVVNTYADGNGGTYNENIDACGGTIYIPYVNPYNGPSTCCNAACVAPAGHLVSEGCLTYGADPYNYVYQYTDGCGGFYQEVEFYDSRCGYTGGGGGGGLPTAPPAPPAPTEPAGCIPPGGYDDTLGQTDCCSGEAVPESTVCDDPADYGNGWASCYHICA